MVAMLGGAYVGGMPTDLASVLASNFRRLRVAHAGTQERFAELTGWKQGQISELETAKRWNHVQKVGARLEKAGIDAAELLAPPEVVEEQAPSPPPYVQEAVELIQSADEATREALLKIMRMVAAQSQSARG